MVPDIAVAHYPEGAGHATRMLAVAKALERDGASVRLAGGGAGEKFVERNGYEEYVPTTVDYIDTYQGGSMRRVLAESVPKTAARVTDYIEWLRETEPDALLTDDMFAAMAALRTDVPLYVLKHDLPALYDDRIERAGATFHTVFQHAAAREFFYPTVWPRSGDERAGVRCVPPVALDGDSTERGSHDVVVVPSHYSELGRIAGVLERQGLDVVDVGSDEWDPVSSLLPYIRAADVVVCSGYSTVMDAAVAGTPCVVHPATDEQGAVADWIDRFDVDGFAVAEEPLDVVEAVASPPDAPSFENGASVVADAVLADLDAHAPAQPPDEERATGPERPADRGGVTSAVSSRVGAAHRGVADRAVANAAAAGTAARAGALRGRRAVADAARALARGGAALRRRLTAACRRTGSVLVTGVRAVGSRLRATVATWRRYCIATSAFAVAVLTFARGSFRARVARTRRRVSVRSDAVKSVAWRGLRAATGVARTVADGVSRLGGGLKAAFASTE